MQEGNTVKRNLAIFILALTLVFTGCGSSSDNSYNTAAQSSSAMAKEELSMDSAENGFDLKNSPTGALSGEAETPRKIVKNSTMNMETKEFDDAVPYIVNLVEEKGGYIQSQSTNGSSLYNKGDRYCRNADITARIPAENLEETQIKLGEMFNITYRNDYIDDITDNYYDATARLNTLQKQEEKLMELLDKAENLSDVIELEKALADCRANIDALTGKIKRMDNMVAYSTITMQISEVIEYQDVATVQLTFGKRVKRSFGIGMKQLKNMFSNTFFFILEDLPVVIVTLIIWGTIIWFMVWLVRKIIRKLKSSKTKEDIKCNKNKYESPNYNSKDSIKENKN